MIDQVSRTLPGFDDDVRGDQLAQRCFFKSFFEGLLCHETLCLANIWALLIARERRESRIEFPCTTKNKGKLQKKLQQNKICMSSLESKAIKQTILIQAHAMHSLLHQAADSGCLKYQSLPRWVFFRMQAGWEQQ